MLFNLTPGEVHQGIVAAYKALKQKLAASFRGRQLETKTNKKGQAYVEIPAFFSVKFRIYAPDQSGKSTVMAVVDDLYAKTGEVNGKSQYDNPIFWGRVVMTESRGESLFFFKDDPKEAIEVFKSKLVERNLVEPAKLEGL